LSTFCEYKHLYFNLTPDLQDTL